MILMKNVIINILKNNDKGRYPRFIKNADLLTAYLIILKYLCETDELKLVDVIQENEIYDIIYRSYVIKQIITAINIPIHTLLIKYKNNNSKELLLEFLSSLDKKITFHNDDENILYMDVPFDLFELYNINGNGIYINGIDTNRAVDYYSIFKYFDKILGINNKYLNEEDIDYEKYNYLYIYNDIPKFRLVKNNNEYTKIRKYLLFVDNIILYTTYFKIRNFTEGRNISNYLNKIIIHNNDATLLFKKDNTGEISIINYKDNIDIEKIIKNNRKQKDVLVKITENDLKENNYRIGFNLYNIDKDDKQNDINKIIKENSKYIELLSTLDSRIQFEIDMLLNK